jgi:hypothetical protein
MSNTINKMSKMVPNITIPPEINALRLIKKTRQEGRTVDPIRFALKRINSIP